MDNTRYMERAIELSLTSWGNVSPNPYVGAVIVKGDKIVGEGWHHQAGQPHAEIEALKVAGEAAKGSTLYVSLEPCCHHGKTPPCTEAIIKSGITKVVYAVDDANPLVAGKSKKILEDAGIEVISGVLEKIAREVNEIFFFNQERKMPFVALKAATSLDGKMATSTRDSKWITGEKAREKAHELRAAYDAILIGSGTLNYDDPELTVRNGKYKGKNPIRIVVAGQALSLDLSAQIFETEKAPTWLIHSFKEIPTEWERLENQGVKLIFVESDHGKVDLKKMLKSLWDMGIKSLFIEGGPKIHGEFLDKRLVQRLYLFQAPLLIGGEKAPTIWDGIGSNKVQDGIKIEELKMDICGKDILVTGRLIGEV